MIIRNESNQDVDVITKVTEAAFKELAVSQQTEQFIIKALRKAGVLTVSLVAEVDGEVVGHVAFSPATLSDGSSKWYGLGPVSVLPEYQKQGIGSELINKGLSILKDKKANGCAVVGEAGYYERFGFKHVTGLTYEGVPDEAFLIMPFNDKAPQGIIKFHEAFFAKE